MKVYERRASSPFKWIFAGLLFVIVMTFTMAEVNGFNRPPSTGNSGNDNQISQPNNHGQNDGTDGRRTGSYPPDNDPPCAVPEPTTFLLMAAGLGFALWYSRRKAAQI